MADDKLIEAWAAVAHESWSGWTKYMLDCLESPERELHIARWRRQLASPYAELSEKEKESDRVEARKYLEAFVNYVSKDAPRCRTCGLPSHQAGIVWSPCCDVCMATNGRAHRRGCHNDKGEERA